MSEMVRRQVPGQQHPVFEASDVEDDFPVALDLGGRISGPSPPTSVDRPDTWKQLEQIMPDLYPAGPMDQELWVRAGGDPSRLHLNETGRTAWFKALSTLRLGGGGTGIRKESLIRTSLEDYPHHPALSTLRGFDENHRCP